MYGVCADGHTCSATIRQSDSAFGLCCGKQHKQSDAAARRRARRAGHLL
jgi:hypothetical protein